MGWVGEGRVVAQLDKGEPEYRSQRRKEQLSLEATTVLSHFKWKDALLKEALRDISGSPVVKTSPPNPRGVGSIPGWGPKIPICLQAHKPEHKQQKQY